MNGDGDIGLGKTIRVIFQAGRTEIRRAIEPLFVRADEQEKRVYIAKTKGTDIGANGVSPRVQ